jgi:UDP-glucose 4-epimerase
MRVVVTGANGYIGSHLVAGLRRHGRIVYCVDTHLDPWRLPCSNDGRLKVVQMDLCCGGLSAFVRRFRTDVLIHLAGPSRIESFQSGAPAIARELGPLAQVLKACVHGTVPRVVYAVSGGALYGPQQDDAIVDEDSPKAPDTLYGATKLLGFMLLKQQLEGTLTAGISLALGNVYGSCLPESPGHGVIDEFCRRAVLGLPLRLTGTGREVRDYVHINDAIAAIEKACTSGVGLINIGTGRATSTEDILNEIRRSEPSVSVEHRPDPTGCRRGYGLGVTKALAELDWAPTTRLEDGIRMTLEWYRAQRAS